MALNCVLIWGLGVSGCSAANWLLSNGIRVLVFDDNWNDAKKDFIKTNLALSEVADINQEVLSLIDYVVVSPGVSVWHPKYQMIARMGIRIKTDISLFLDNFTGITIGVTGTNGKSTITAMLSYVANKNGYRAMAAGNIGVPCLDILAQNPDLVVLELSSFHLAHGLASKLNFGILLNIAPDHINWHRSWQHYVFCKYRVLDYSVFGLNLSAINGDLNIETASLDFIAKALNWSDLCIKNFSSLPHRLQEFSVLDRLWVNDSKATNAHATLFACNKYSDKSPVLILAGQSKGWNYEQIPKSIKAVILIGDIKLWQLVVEENKLYQVADVAEAVCLAYRLSSLADIILFSPGGASFDQFANFSERGNYFMEQVRCLESTCIS